LSAVAEALMDRGTFTAALYPGELLYREKIIFARGIFKISLFFMIELDLSIFPMYCLDC